MSDRPTPMTDAIEDTAARNPPIWKHARDLERKLAEANEQLARYEKRLDSSQRARRSLSDAADHLNKRLREEQAKLAEAREALELAAKLPTHQDCPGENHGIVVAAMEALARIDANTMGKDTP